jgi:hypothetical protein
MLWTGRLEHGVGIFLSFKSSLDLGPRSHLVCESLIASGPRH